MDIHEFIQHKSESLNALTGGQGFGRLPSRKLPSRSSLGLNALTGGQGFGPDVQSL